MRKLSLKDCCASASLRGGECLSERYINNSAKYLWKCRHGHKWEATYGNVRQGHWCPFCVGKARKTLKDCHNLARKNDGKFLSKKYINVHTKYCWRCKKGHEWEAIYGDVRSGDWCPSCAAERRAATNIKRYGFSSPMKNADILAKSRETCMRKYGVEHPMQSKEIALRSARSMNDSFVLFHWKTNEELVCVGSYEKAAVEYLNENKIEFKWQPEIFTTPILTPTGKNSTYRPDLYLVKEDRWIEIKGYFRKDAQDKWNWFHKKYPNSELWDEKKLIKLNVIK